MISRLRKSPRRSLGATSAGAPVGRVRLRASGRLRGAAAWVLLGAGMGSGLIVPGVASAEEQPAILKAYGLDWIERVREEAWPQPKAQRPVICLLDTGVNVTPDTPPDDPNGPIVARLALDGGTGFAQGTDWQHEHGTQMASIIAAPRNGWGTVGVFPQARIVSIRVTDGANTFITPDAIDRGVRRCVQWAFAAGVRPAVVTVPESNYDQRSVDLAWWNSAGTLASAHRALFVAAAGNSASDSPIAPFGVSGALVVAAGDADGRACPFVAGTKQEGALRGPGCFSSRSWPAGSSAATVAVAALAAALTTQRPDGSPAEIRSAIDVASSIGPDGERRLSAEAIGAAFPLQAGLTQAVPQVEAEVTKSTSSERVRMWRPRVRATWSRGRLRIARLDRRARGRIVVQLAVRGGGTRNWEAKHASRAFRVRVSKPGVVRVWIASPEVGQWRSLTVRSAVR